MHVHLLGAFHSVGHGHVPVEEDACLQAGDLKEADELEELELEEDAELSSG